MLSLFSELRPWLPLVCLTCAGFIFNTSEFIPIGLLTDIALDFEISEAHAGMMIAIYAWVVAVASLPLMLMVAKMEMRRLLLCVIGVFVLSHVISALSSNFNALVASRIGVACAHAIFWSIATPMAVRVAPEGRKEVALSMIIAGTAVAMVVGLPLGRVIGLYIGWRITFFGIGLIAFLIMLSLFAVFPKMPSRGGLSLHQLPKLLGTPALAGIYIMTAVAVTGYYSGYSYIEPFLGQIAKQSPDTVTMLLTTFGLVGIAGSLLFSRFDQKHHYFFVLFAVLGLTVSLFLLYPASFTLESVIAVLILWGLAATFYNLVFQEEIIRLAPQAAAIAMSVYSGIFNLGIGSGAFVGGLVTDHWSLALIGVVGGGISLLASLFCVFKLVPMLKAFKGNAE